MELSSSIRHVPVLVDSVLGLLSPQAGEIALDCTLGHGGHAALLLQAIGSTGRLVGLDVDASNLETARARIVSAVTAESAPRVDLVRSNFAEFESALDSLGIPAVDVILADLGVSTDQLLDPSRGLTFSEDAPLDMRLDDRLNASATELVNSLDENALSDLIFFNSQERFSRRIAKRICQARREGRIRRTSELVRIVCSATGMSPDSRPGKIHPATRTFLALRMAVNRELENLKALLDAAPRRLRPGGRIGVISFHSGEDRIVKQNFLDLKRSGVYSLRTKKPVGPNSDEIRQNPRSRSAKLRVAQRVAESTNAA